MRFHVFGSGDNIFMLKGWISICMYNMFSRSFGPMECGMKSMDFSIFFNEKFKGQGVGVLAGQVEGELFVPFSVLPGQGAGLSVHAEKTCVKQKCWTVFLTVFLYNCTKKGSKITKERKNFIILILFTQQQQDVKSFQCLRRFQRGGPRNSLSAWMPKGFGLKISSNKMRK